MTHKVMRYLLLFVAAVGLVACNSSDDEITVSSESNTAVTSFYLNANAKVLDHLDSVYFSIDLNRALIYNADSLPYGTDVSRLVVTFTTNGCSVADLIVPRGVNQADTTINYLENPTDSIDFTNGPVTLHLVSLDELATRDYKIFVNVHQVKPDSLIWQHFEYRNLPTAFYEPTEQKTVELNDDIVCLTSFDDEYCLTWTNLDDYSQLTVSKFDFKLQVKTFTATTDSLYVLGEDGTLYRLLDANQWESCGVKWHHIYGGYGDMLLGVEKDGDKYYHVTYPETEKVLVEKDFPVEGTGQMQLFETKWSKNPQAIIVGGVRYDGKVIGDTWAYDGERWMKINQDEVLPCRQEMTLVPYFAYKTNEKNWKVTKNTVLLAMFGKNQAGECVKDVYMSFDQGIHWASAGTQMQMPLYITERCNAQAFVRSHVISRASVAGWNAAPAIELPRGYVIDSDFNSRAVADITEWECPYIYLFGGESTDGITYNAIWRGVINRLTFKPLY